MERVNIYRVSLISRNMYCNMVKRTNRNVWNGKQILVLIIMKFKKMFKLLSILHYVHPKPNVGPVFFEGTVTGDSYVKMLDEDVFPSILNETNDFVLLYAFKFRR